jgi:ABC-type Fe3+-hydroxamate transport system substrate-binding protein
MQAATSPNPSSGLADAAGTVHEPAGHDARIVCLVPSITELLCDLGLSEQLVGRTEFCIHPRETVRTIPTVGGTKDVRVDRILGLAPTHAVVNIEENRRSTAEGLADFVPHIVVTHPQGPRDNLDLYRLLGGIFGRQAAAERLCASFEDVYARVSEAPRRPRDLLYLIWREPWMTVAPDTYISRTLALFNWRTQPTTASEPYPRVDINAFAGKVDRVLLSSEPYHFRECHVREVVAAVDGAEVSLIDGEMTSWYGSRAIQGLRYLAEYTRRCDRAR